MTPRHFSNLNHHKPLGSMVLAGTANPGQLSSCVECIPSGMGPFVFSVPCEIRGFQSSLQTIESMLKIWAHTKMFLLTKSKF